MEFGPFTLLTRLGRGGMGEVWKARGPGPDGAQQTLVVKRILTHLAADDDVERSFLREVRLSEQLTHPNIVRMFGGGRIGDELYLTMEYLEGVDLYRLVRAYKSRRISPPVALGACVARDVCRALAHAYNAVGDDGVPLRLVHRDVTPTNIMITRDGQVKLLDFGLAKALSEVSEGHTKTGTLKGKFGYMAPEQIDGESARHQSDQFSLGVVLHETLSGHRLFRGETDVQTIFNVKNLAIEPPSSVNGSVSAELAQICLRALERDPRARFRTCAEMAAALDPVVASASGGSAQLAALVHELFPAGVQGVSLALPASVPKHVTMIREEAPRLPLNRRWLAGAVGFACVVAIGAGAGFAWKGHERPVAKPTPPVTAAPPTPSEMAQPPREPSANPMSVAATPPAPQPAPAPPVRARPKSPKPQHAKISASAKNGSGSASTASGGTMKGEDIRGGAIVDPFAK